MSSDVAQALRLRGLKIEYVTITPDDGTLPAVVRIDFEGTMLMEFTITTPLFVMDVKTLAHRRYPEGPHAAR